MKRAKKFMSFFVAAAVMITGVLPAAAYEKPENAETVLHDGYASAQDAYAFIPFRRVLFTRAESSRWEKMYR